MLQLLVIQQLQCSTGDTATSDASTPGDASTSTPGDASTPGDTATSTPGDTSTSDASTPGDTATSDASTPGDTSTSDASTPGDQHGDTATSDASTPGDASTSSLGDTSTPGDASTSADNKETSLINELVKTGKFTESEAKQFASKSIQNETDNSSTSDNTQSSNNQSNNKDQSSNASTNNPEEYDNFDDLINDIKNHIVDIEDISLNAFQDSGAYQRADEETQDCIDLAGKIGDNLGDHEIVNCFEDPNFYKNQISNADNNNNADDTVN